MSIFMMCKQDDEGAVEVTASYRTASTDPNWRCFVRESHVGVVISLRERNGYDDSDFLATVWNETEQKVEELEYASTRGWSYPNHAAIDATPEVLEKVVQYRLRLARLSKLRKLRNLVKEARTVGLTSHQWADVRKALGGRHWDSSLIDCPSKYNPPMYGMLPRANEAVGRVLDALQKLKRDSFRSDFKRSLAEKVREWAITPSDQRKFASPLSPKQLKWVG